MTINSAHVRHYRQQLRDAPSTAAALARELGDGLKAVASYNDPDLTAEALRNRRADRREAFMAEAQQRVPGYRTGFERARDYLLTEAKTHTQFPAGDVAAVVIATQKWNGIVRMIDAGAPLSRLISGVTDVPTLLAIAEYGPMLAAADSYKEPEVSDRLLSDSMAGRQSDPLAGGAWVQDAVWSRIAEVTPDSALADLLNGALEAGPLCAIADPLLQAAENYATHGSADVLSAQIQSDLAKQSYTPRPDGTEAAAA